MLPVLIKTISLLKVAFATFCTGTTYLICFVELYSELRCHLMKYFSFLLGF